MLRNADISYSSITPNRRNDTCSCCFCSCHCSLKSCCKCCLLRLPYGTITSALLSICGLVIITSSFVHSNLIADRLFSELLHRKYLWFSDLKVIYIIVSIVIGVLILVNLMIGFATTGRKQKNNARGDEGCRLFCCARGSATTCLVKTVFLLNYLLYHAIFFLTMASIVCLFICYLLSTLCNEKKTMNPMDHSIDLKLFAPFLGIRSNETKYLYFEGPRLKKLCVDYMSSLILYILLGTVGFIIMCWGFMNFLINLSVNWTRLSTKQKCAELMYINAAEMTAFGDGGTETGSRY